MCFSVAALLRVVSVLVLSSNLQQAQFYTDMDPTLRQILQEKEQTILALQQTVEVGVHTHTHTEIRETVIKLTVLF